MTFLHRGSGFVGSDSPLRGASLALSGMADLNPCIPLSARESATGIPLDAVLPIGQGFDEQELLVLEDNCCPGVSGAVWSLPARPGASRTFHGDEDGMRRSPGQALSFHGDEDGFQGGGLLAAASAGNVNIGSQRRQSGVNLAAVVVYRL